MERREFLKLGATAAGGMIIGLHLPQSRAAGVATGPVQLNAWIRIDPDNRITFVCHRNEMGQDVHTSLAMLVAEELEVPVASLAIEQAPVAAVYTNAMIGAQITGGSTSIRDAWLPLRRAGAAARTVLLEAAAKTWQVDVGVLEARNGYVVNRNGNKLSYGFLSGIAAELPLPAPEYLALKAPGSFTQIGSPTQKRLDTRAKVHGERLFGLDATQPGMVYAALAQCPVIGGTVAGVDAAAARAMPGVRDVIDIGEGVAVVADHFWVAKQARDALKISWNTGAGKAVSDASIAAALRAGSKEAGATARANGDIDAGLAKASKRLEAEYELPLLAHVAMEPMNCLARVDDEGCDIWTSTQYPAGAQAVAAARAGLAPEQVKIHSQFIGGGFGRRLDVDFIAQAAAIAKAVPGVPVKLVWTREDDTTHDFYRPASLHRLRGGLDVKGKLIALDHLMVSQSVTERAFPGVVKDGLDPFMTEGASNLVYAVPNLRSRVVIKDTGVRVGYWRSVSHALNAFAFESFIDELAKAGKPRSAAVPPRDAGGAAAPARGAGEGCRDGGMEAFAWCQRGARHRVDGVLRQLHRDDRRGAAPRQGRALRAHRGGGRSGHRGAARPGHRADRVGGDHGSHRRAAQPHQHRRRRGAGTELRPVPAAAHVGDAAHRRRHRRQR